MACSLSLKGQILNDYRHSTDKVPYFFMKRPATCQCPLLKYDFFYMKWSNFPYIGVDWLRDSYQHISPNFDNPLEFFVDFDGAALFGDSAIAGYDIGRFLRIAAEEDRVLKTRAYATVPIMEEVSKIAGEKKPLTYCKAGYTCKDSFPRFRGSDMKYYPHNYLYCLTNDIGLPVSVLYLKQKTDSSLLYKHCVFGDNMFSFRLHTYCSPNPEDWLVYLPKLLPTEIEILQDSLCRPKEKRFYVAGNRQWQRSLITHSYGEETDTQRYYRNFDLEYLRHQYMPSDMSSREFSNTPDSGTVLLMTAIYKKGKLLSLHHDYLEKCAREAQALSFFDYSFAKEYKYTSRLSVDSKKFTYRVEYNEMGEISKIYSPTPYQDQVCEVNFSYSDYDERDNWQQMHIHIGDTTENNRPNCTKSFSVWRSIEYRP